MTERNPLLDDILIIIVLYKKSILDSLSFQSLSHAIDPSSGFTLFIYDNSPTAHAVPDSKSMEIRYYHDPTNAGVSKAYNEGFKLATQLNKKWLLLADQDTEFPPSVFHDYARAVQDHPRTNIIVPSLYDSVGLISPFQLIWGKGGRIKSLHKSSQNFNRYKVINSGMLISVEAFARANGYDEQFSLDYSDLAFLDRVQVNDPNFTLIPSQWIHHFSATTYPKGRSVEMDRFASFCKAVRLYKKTSTKFVSLVWVILPRALKLSLEMRTFLFLKTGLQHVLWNA